MTEIGSERRTTYEDLAPFFGDMNGKARLFITLNYKGSNYTEPLNTRENPDTIKAEPLWQLMLAKNYNKDNKPEAHDDVTISNTDRNKIALITGITGMDGSIMADLLLQKNTHPEQEIDKVTTPMGCTIAGLNEMEHNGFSSSFIKGITISAKQAKDLYTEE